MGLQGRSGLLNWATHLIHGTWTKSRKRLNSMRCYANFLHTKDMKSSFFPLCWGVPEPCSNAWKGQPWSLELYPLKRTNYTVSSTSTTSTLYTSLSNSDARLSGHQKPGGGSKEDSPPIAICPTHRGRPVNRPTPYAEKR